MFRNVHLYMYTCTSIASVSVSRLLYNVNLHVHVYMYLNSFSFLSLYLFLSLVGDLPDGRWVASRIFLPLHYLIQILDKIRGMYSMYMYIHVHVHCIYAHACIQVAQLVALCLECGVSWVRIPPEAAHFLYAQEQTFFSVFSLHSASSSEANCSDFILTSSGGDI